MAGYVVQASVRGVRPRPVPRPVTRHVTRAAIHQRCEPVDHDTVELSGRPFAHDLSQRLERWRELWAQTTFYLFDADGWR